MKVQARVVSAESGQVLGSVDRPLPIKVKHCEDEEGGLPTQQSVAEASSHDLAEAIANYVAPHFELREFELEKIRSKQFEGLGERAAELAEALRVDEAYAIYKSIHDQDAYSPEVLVDLAILNEVVGNYRQAREFYEQALQLKKNDDYKRGFDRVTKSLSFHDALAQLGVVIQEHTFAAAAADVARATANMVESRGGGADRSPTRAQADDHSEVVASVPGGVTFQVVREEGDWFRIKLLGGKEGYVQKDRVKLRQQ